MRLRALTDRGTLENRSEYGRECQAMGADEWKKG